MDINRRGSQRNRGTTSVISGLGLRVGGDYQWENNVRWDSAKKQIVINAGVADPIGFRWKADWRPPGQLGRYVQWKVPLVKGVMACGKLQ